MCFRRKPKEIDPKLNINSREIIYYHKLRKNKIRMGAHLKVPRNYAFTVVSERRVLDVLAEGKYIIEIKELPECTKKFRLYKIDKRKRAPKFFIAEPYFINMNMREGFKWATADKIELEDKAYGAYLIRSFGELNFKIIDPKLLLEYLLQRTDNIVTVADAETNISTYINDKVSRIIEKLNPLAKNLYLKDETILKELFEKLSTWLEEIGIELDGITLTETKFPPQVLADLRSNNDTPKETQGWGKMSFEEWQTNNPAPEIKKPKFITIIPTGKKGPFFKESMAPYFFEDEKEEVEEEPKEQPQIWKTAEEKIDEEASKRIVNLNIDEE